MTIDELNAALPAIRDGQQLQQAVGTLLRLPREEQRLLAADDAAALYDRLPAELAGRHLALVLLGVGGDPEHLQLLADRLVDDPPGDWMQAAYALSPLMQRDDWDPADLFPRVLDGLGHISLAAPLLDLANRLTRTGRVSRHPAADRAPQLTSLLGGVAGQLGKMEEDPSAFGDSVETVQRALGEGVALCVALCDALALMGEEGAIPKLNQALALAHRRVQTEAAGALAKLGDAAGRDRLLELAAEPSARLRVLAYADELDIADAVDPEYTTPSARAEAELALWLSQPQQMGLPPTRLELLDHRRQYWPSYNDPVDCFLFRFSYDLGERDYSNVGIVGPAVHAFAADLAELPIDEIYAAFAGWQAEHDDIFEIRPEGWNRAQRRVAEQLTEHLDHEGFEDIQPAFLGLFLGERALAATVSRDTGRGVTVTDGLETVWYATEGRQRPLQPADVWAIYKGRKMLRSFN